MPEKPGEQALPGRGAPPRTRSSRDLASRRLRSGTTLPDSADAELHAATAAHGQPKKDRDNSESLYQPASSYQDTRLTCRECMHCLNIRDIVTGLMANRSCLSSWLSRRQIATGSAPCISQGCEALQCALSHLVSRCCRAYRHRCRSWQSRWHACRRLTGCYRSEFLVWEVT